MRRVLPTLLCALALAGCRRTANENRSTPSSTSAEAVAGSSPLASTTSPPGDWAPPPFAGSVYDLGLTLEDHDGRPVPLDVFRGHPVLITMFYGSCPNACPLLTTDIKRLDKQFAVAARERVRILMVSFDAARDTPTQLARFISDHAVDTSRWKLAAAREDPARDLAAALGIRYRKINDTEYFHSSSIILLDESGKIVARVEGLGKDPSPILEALR